MTTLRRSLSTKRFPQPSVPGRSRPSRLVAGRGQAHGWSVGLGDGGGSMGAEVRVGVAEDGADEARLEELALLLRQELLTLDVQSVEAVRDSEAPPGTRGGLAAIAGLL